MKFHLLIEAHHKITVRELHVERVTGRLDDVTREHIQVLRLEPAEERLMKFGEPEVGRLSSRESNLKNLQPPKHPPTSANWEEQERAREAQGPATCHICGERTPAAPEDTRSWICPRCHTLNDKRTADFKEEETTEPRTLECQQCGEVFIRGVGAHLPSGPWSCPICNARND